MGEKAVSHSDGRAAADQIVVVGGYGQVGREVARRLAPAFPGRVVVAGRRLDRAEAFAAEVGHGARAVQLDLAATPPPAPPTGARLVVMCVDQDGTGFVERCLAAGVDYVDVTAKEESLCAFERLAPLARERGATAVLSVGVSPGITNLLAAHAVAQLDEVQRVDLFLMAGLGDEHGDGAIEWMLDNLDAAFDVPEGGALRRVQGFGARTRVRLLGERRARSGYRFNFPDQRVVARTLAVPSASTWFLLDSRLLTWLFHLVAWSGLARVLRGPALRRRTVRALGALRLGSDACAVQVRAEGRSGGQAVVREVALAGRREAALTGLTAAEVARELLERRGPGGVLHLEQLVRPADFLQRLQAIRPETRLWL